MMMIERQLTVYMKRERLEVWGRVVEDACTILDAGDIFLVRMDVAIVKGQESGEGKVKTSTKKTHSLF